MQIQIMQLLANQKTETIFLMISSLKIALHFIKNLRTIHFLMTQITLLDFLMKLKTMHSFLMIQRTAHNTLMLMSDMKMSIHQVNKLYNS